MQNIPSTLAGYAPDICGELHRVFLRGTYEWRNNVMTMCDKSRTRCTR